MRFDSGAICHTASKKARWRGGVEAREVLPFDGVYQDRLAVRHGLRRRRPAYAAAVADFQRAEALLRQLRHVLEQRQHVAAPQRASFQPAERPGRKVLRLPSTGATSIPPATAR